jgi:hypothetical protein
MDNSEVKDSNDVTNNGSTDHNDESSNSDNTNQINIIDNFQWTPDHEEILIEWADKAMCYRWLHSKANSLYSSLNAWYTIPCIIISTLAGTANFAQQRVPIKYQGVFSMGVGGINILGGIISTIQQFLKITQLNEAHRVSSISWDKFYRNIKIELAKHPLERLEVKQMVKMSKEEFDRLMETSPSIPENIVRHFKTNFNSIEGFKSIVKPEICDILIPTNEYRNPWYNEENKYKIVDEQLKLRIIKEERVKKISEQNIKTVKDFIQLFITLNNREPMESEVIDNLKEKIDITIVKKILDENKIFLKQANNDDNINNIV